MNIVITFRNIEHTDGLDEVIKKKTQKISKYGVGITDVSWICSVKKGEHFAEVVLHGPTMQYQAQGATDSLYKTIDVVMDKLERQLVKKKEKWKNRIHETHKLESNEEENEEEQD